MKHKNGFTLVELLAVIAILAILVVIALPAVLEIFNQSKKEAFMTQARIIFKGAESKFVLDMMTGEGDSDNVYTKCSSEEAGDINVSGSTDGIMYIMKFDGGVPAYFVITNGEYTASAGAVDNTNAISVSDIVDQADDDVLENLDNIEGCDQS